MKVIIPAAGKGTRLGKLGENIPKCLMEVNGVPLLKRTIELFKEYHITDITVIVGKDGVCWTKKNIQKIKDLGVKVIVNPNNETTFQSYSIALAINPKEGFIAVDGDIYFSKKALETILYSKYPNVILSRTAMTHGDGGGKIKIDEQGNILYCGMEEPEEFPWEIYSGMIKVGKDSAGKFKKLCFQYAGNEIMHIINILKDTFKIVRIDYEFTKEQSGSEAQLELIQTVRKTAYDFATAKLGDEIAFLQKLPPELQEYFSEVKIVKQSKKELYYEMPKYPYPSLRTLLFSGSIDAKGTLKILDNVLNFMFTKMYTKQKMDTPPDYIDWVHFKRVKSRLQRTRDMNSAFAKIINADKLIFNGKEYMNTPLALAYLENNTEIIKKCTPKFVSPLCHSDLHFANILVNAKTRQFRLIDPRGYKYCDYYYDFGKIWHSVHSLYDYLSEERYKFSGKDFNYNCKYPKDALREEYKELEKRVPALLQKYAEEPLEDVMMKTRFNEAIHFSCFMPLYLEKGKFEQALIGYLIGMQCLNEFNRDYCKEFKEFININTVDMLQKVQQAEKK